MVTRTFLGVLGDEPDLAAALVGVLHTLARSGVAALPRVGLLDGAVVARGLYREWLAGEPWAPLLVLDPGLLTGPDDVAAAAPIARGGWIYLGSGWEARIGRADAERIAREARARLLLQVDDSLGPLKSPTVAALRALDAHHAVATDPTLARARGALLSHCARAETVYLSGPVGSGRRALARWAHATLDDRPLTVLATGSPPEPGTWWLVPEVGELDPAVLGSLRARLEAEDPDLAGPAYGGTGERPANRAFATVVGRSAGLCAVLREAEKVAAADTRVVILGESGVGKEPLVSAIHAASGRRGKLVAVDLASRSANLVEDDLFGHVPFAFDGARTSRDGAFKRAHKGTLFLDEIANLPLGLQAKLLRVLEKGEIVPLGSDEPVAVDVRVVCATNEDLDAKVRVGEFRKDLYHRLAGKILRIPPLRTRPDDVIPIFDHYLRAAGHDGRLTPEAREILLAHRWPGNVRELVKVTEAAAHDAQGVPVEPEHLGELAPSRARRAPVLVTGDAAALDALPLPRRQVRQLAALTLTLDGPAERGPACVRNAVLDHLRGRALTPEALRVLEAHPWWGGFVEMGRKLAALAASPPGVLDRARLVACLPELGQVSGWEPILAVQHPTVRDDTIVGLQASLAAAGVVIGRARRMADVEGTRAAWLGRLLGDGSVAWLPFPHLGALSRVHVVITRLGEGLLAHRAPGARLDVRAGPVGGGLESVEEGGFVALGEAGVVQVLGEDGPLVELYLFRGQVALRAAAPLLGVAADVRATQVVGGGAVLRARTLEPAEGEWVHDFVLRAVDGEELFTTALRRDVREAPGRYLRDYLDSANVPQSFKRLLEHKGNAPLCARICESLCASGRRERARARLPAQVWAVLCGEGAEER